MSLNIMDERDPSGPFESNIKLLRLAVDLFGADVDRYGFDTTKVAAAMGQLVSAVVALEELAVGSSKADGDTTDPRDPLVLGPGAVLESAVLSYSDRVIIGSGPREIIPGEANFPYLVRFSPELLDAHEKRVRDQFGDDVLLVEIEDQRLTTRKGRADLRRRLGQPSVPMRVINYALIDLVVNQQPVVDSQSILSTLGLEVDSVAMTNLDNGLNKHVNGTGILDIHERYVYSFVPNLVLRDRRVGHIAQDGVNGHTPDAVRTAKDGVVAAPTGGKSVAKPVPPTRVVAEAQDEPVGDNQPDRVEDRQEPTQEAAAGGRREDVQYDAPLLVSTSGAVEEPEMRGAPEGKLEAVLPLDGEPKAVERVILDKLRSGPLTIGQLQGVLNRARHHVSHEELSDLLDQLARRQELGQAHVRIGSARRPEERRVHFVGQSPAAAKPVTRLDSQSSAGARPRRSNVDTSSAMTARTSRPATARMRSAVVEALSDDLPREYRFLLNLVRTESKGLDTLAGLLKRNGMPTLPVRGSEATVRTNEDSVRRLIGSINSVLANQQVGQIVIDQNDRVTFTPAD